MKAFLLFRDRDFLPPQAVTAAQQDVIKDLALDTLLAAMAGDDSYLQDICRAVLLDSLTSPEDIRYRQDILRDCLRLPELPEALYRLAVEAIQAEHEIWGSLFSSAESKLNRSMQVMGRFVVTLRQLAQLADQYAGQVGSDGLIGLFALVGRELSDTYLAEMESRLRTLRFKNGMLVSARLDAVNRGTEYVIREPTESRPGLRTLLSPGTRPAGLTLIVADRDISGHQTLSDLRDRGIATVADALAEACDHILGFFTMLRREVGFYLGCLRLHARLTAIGQPVCTPAPVPPTDFILTAAGLCEPCLALVTGAATIGNNLDADGCAAVIVTGANQGGKSTFLRSVGLAQLMMQCGLFVTAENFTASTATGVWTHFKRAEDTGLTSGKFDEELARMCQITEAIRPGALLLCNESFAATNEREGSHIARNVTLAMLDSGVRVFFVTHFYELAHWFVVEDRSDVMFLRAMPEPDGHRTYQLTPGKPRPTSYADDIYHAVFGEARDLGGAPPAPAG